MKCDVIIIGAGAAGLMCALTAAGRGRSVAVLEHTWRGAGKMRVSGGGRCNFTNLNACSEDYISRNPDFTRSALARFTPLDFVRMVDSHRIRYEEKERGQLFCSSGSAEIVRMLQGGCADAGVRILRNCRINGIEKGHRFIVQTSQGTVESPALVVATGGMSWPILGATNLGYRIARQFGLTVTPLSPGLVPLTFGRADRKAFGELSGVSFKAIVRCGSRSVYGDMLLTHRGLSGPAILDISLYWSPGMPLSLSILPEADAYGLLVAHKGRRMKIENLLGMYIPLRFAQRWCRHTVPSKPLNRYSERELRDIASALSDWRLTPSGTEGYDRAEVTVGGVDTSELSSKTMEARKMPGLYFIGEVVDVTGRLGGFNLQWAWSSGYAAGQHV